MRSQVLYFPYISVPKSAWMMQMLLYWDQVKSIVPSQVALEPESMGAHMGALVREELVEMVLPAMHVHQIPDFELGFLDYVENLGSELDKIAVEIASIVDITSMFTWRSCAPSRSALRL